MNGRIIRVYLLLPLVGFPVYFVVANAIDTLFGEKQLLTWFLFESLPLLLRTSLADWLHSLPVMYLVFIALLLPVHLVLARLKRLTPALFSGLVSAVMFMFSSAAGFSPNGVMTNTLTVMLFALLCALFTDYSGKTRAPA